MSCSWRCFRTIGRLARLHRCVRLIRSSVSRITNLNLELLASCQTTAATRATPLPAHEKPTFRRLSTRRGESGRVHLRIEGVWVMPTSRPSGLSSRVTSWPQGSFRDATSSW